MRKLKTVMILGASRYYQRSIQAARRAGYRVVAVDRNSMSEGFSVADVGEVCDIVDRAGVLRLAKEYGIDGIVPINDYGVLTAAHVAAELGLPGITPEAAELATNKEAMRQRWRDAGVPCPAYALASDVDSIRQRIRQIGLPCILKPAHGVGGASRGVIVVRDDADVDEAIEFSCRFYEDKTTLVEEFVTGELEHSAEVLVWKGIPHVIAIADKVKTPLPYRVDKNVLYPSALTGSRLAAIRKTIAESVRALDIVTGAAHVELASTRDGFVLFELGARCGGGGTPEPIVPHVTGIHEFVELVRILCGDEPHDLVPTRAQACNYHFITLAPGRVRAVAGFDRVMHHPQVLDAELFVKPGGQIEPVTFGTQRSGFIIVGGATAAESLALGTALEAGIRVDYDEAITAEAR